MMQYAQVSPTGSAARQLPALAVIVILGAAARCTQLFSHTTMPDEAFTFFIASHPLPQIIWLLKTGDFHPPLVYLIGHALFHVTTRAYLFRLVTTAFGIAGIAWTYLLAVRIVPRGALLTALFVAVCPSLVFFDRFFRMYAVLWPLCVASWLSLLWALDDARTTRRWLVYALTVVLLLYTQYLAVFTLAIQIVFVAVFVRKTIGFWIALVGATLTFAPWLPVLAQQYPLGGNAYNEMRGHLSQMLLAPSVMLLDGLPQKLEYSPITALVLWLLLIGGLLIAVWQRKWIALALCAPVVLQVAYSVVTGKLLLGQRYLLQAIPAAVLLLTLLLAWLFTTRARVISIALCAGLLVLMLCGTVEELFLSPFQPIDWTAYGRFLGSRVQTGDALIFDGAMAYYTLIGTPAVKNSNVFLVADAKKIPALVTAATRFARVWYVDYQSQLPDPKHEVFVSLARSHPQHKSWRTTQAAYGDVVLTTLFVRPAAGKPGSGPGKRGP